MAILSFIEEETIDAPEASGRMKALTRDHPIGNAIHQAQTDSQIVLWNTEDALLPKIG